MKLKLELTKQNDEWTNNELRLALSHLLKNAEGPATPKGQQSWQHDSHSKKILPTVQSLLAGAGVAHTIKCMYCDGKHYSDECQMYKSLDKRKTRLGMKCYIRLKAAHAVLPNNFRPKPDTLPHHVPRLATCCEFFSSAIFFPENSRYRPKYHENSLRCHSNRYGTPTLS